MVWIGRAGTAGHDGAGCGKVGVGWEWQEWTGLVWTGGVRLGRFAPLSIRTARPGGTRTLNASMKSTAAWPAVGTILAIDVPTVAVVFG